MSRWRVALVALVVSVLLLGSAALTISSATTGLRGVSEAATYGSGGTTDAAQGTQPGEQSAKQGTGNGGENDPGTDQDRAEVPNTAEPYVLPPSGTVAPIDTSAPLVTAPLPVTATRAGDIVEGFPRDVIGVASLSTVMSSAVASEGRRLQATLVAVTPRSNADVVSFYRDGLSALGFSAGLETDRSAAFSRGTDTVTVTFATTNGETSYTAHGSFIAGETP